MQFQQLAECLDQVQQTSSRLQKTFILARFFSSVPEKQYQQIILLMQGKVFPEYDETKLGISTRLVLKALSQATGRTSQDVESQFNKLGDVGLVAMNLVGTKRQNTLYAESLEVDRVFKTIRKLATFSGKQSVAEKLSVISGLIGNSTAPEAKYICNILVEQLRVGVAQGVLRDAIIWSVFPRLAAQVYPDVDFPWAHKQNEIQISSIQELNSCSSKECSNIVAKDPDTSRKLLQEITEQFQRGIDMNSSISEAAQILLSQGLQGLQAMKLTLFKPFHVMLAQKAATISEGIQDLGLPVVAEYKYDGFRMQIHVGLNQVRLFTRRLEEVTVQFPDVVERIKKYIKIKNVILDAEVVGIDTKTKKYIAFQNISQRIRRKYNIEELSQKFPVEVKVFDILQYDQQLLIEATLVERRKILEKVVPNIDGLGTSESIIAQTEEQVNEFYTNSLAAGNEGIMLKSLNSPYQPGSRVGFMLKCKPVMENLDVVIVRATKGEGKRAKWLTSFTVACKSLDGDLLEIGKVSTGLKEIDEEGTSFSFMTELLKPLITEDLGKDVIVKPEVVIEVAYEEIQKSPAYSSGFALRFPRFVILRDDRGIEDISDVSYIELLYKQQRGRNT